LFIYARRTDINIIQPLNNCNVKYKIVLTAGAINDTFETLFECNEQDNYNNFINRLCNNIMDNIEWLSFKQNITHNNNIVRTDDILLYFIPPGCNINYVILLADSSLFHDLDYALSRLEWCMNPRITIQQIISLVDSFTLLVTPGKRIPWRRNFTEILLNMFTIKGYE
jgi:hypothetical protein